MCRPTWYWLAALAVLGACAVQATAAQTAQAPTDVQIKANVERQIARLKLGAARVAVSVQGRVVMLDGTLPTLSLKRQVIDRVRKTEGVQEVDATLDIARAESDAQLAVRVAKELRGYSRYTVYDFVDGRVRDGVVTLTGAVTEPVKSNEMAERIENIRGVLDLHNTVRVLPASQMDDRIRVAVAYQIYADPLFGNLSRATPPIRVIVENGHVTLVGVTNSNIERVKAESIARSVSGVFSVDDQLRLPSEIRGQ